MVLTSCLICQPVAYRWNRTIDGICGDQKRLDLFIAVFNLILDVTVVVLPMPILWGLQMPTKKKVVLSGIFGMGIAYDTLRLTGNLSADVFSASVSSPLYEFRSQQQSIREAPALRSNINQLP